MCFLMICVLHKSPSPLYTPNTLRCTPFMKSKAAHYPLCLPEWWSQSPGRCGLGSPITSHNHRAGRTQECNPIMSPCVTDRHAGAQGAEELPPITRLVTAVVRTSSSFAFIIAPDGQLTIYITKDWCSLKASIRGTGASPKSTASPVRVGTVSVLFPRVKSAGHIVSAQGTTLRC